MDDLTKDGSLPDKPGVSNWVEDRGGLPPYIKQIAEDLHTERGMTTGRAIATAINQVKRWARGGGDVKPDTRAKAVAALAQWEAMKGVSKHATHNQKDHGRKGSGRRALNRDDAAKILAKFNALSPDAPTVPHPKSGWQVKKGVQRRLIRPDRNPDEPGMGSERAGLEFSLEDWDQTDSKRWFGTDLGTEKVKHVYRGMSLQEWAQVQERGVIQSDGRGVIVDTEGTNAGIEPDTAFSYLPRNSSGVIVKIRVEDEDEWFTISADSYARSRRPIPIDRIEMVSPVIHKDETGAAYVDEDVSKHGHHDQSTHGRRGPRRLLDSAEDVLTDAIGLTSRPGARTPMPERGAGSRARQIARQRAQRSRTEVQNAQVAQYVATQTGDAFMDLIDQAGADLQTINMKVPPLAIVPKSVAGDIAFHQALSAALGRSAVPQDARNNVERLTLRSATKELGLPDTRMQRLRETLAEDGDTFAEIERAVQITLNTDAERMSRARSEATRQRILEQPDYPVMQPGEEQAYYDDLASFLNKVPQEDDGRTADERAALGQILYAARDRQYAIEREKRAREAQAARDRMANGNFTTDDTYMESDVLAAYRKRSASTMGTVDYNTTGTLTKGLVDSVLATWDYRHASGVEARVTEINVREDIVSIEGEFYDGRTEVGRFTRFVRISHDDAGDPYLTVDHEYFKLEDSKQGEGFATDWNRRAETMYREGSVSRIKVHANINVGGYVWAKQGYDWAQSPYSPRDMGDVETRIRSFENTRDDESPVLRFMEDYQYGLLHGERNYNGPKPVNLPAMDRATLAEITTRWLPHAQTLMTMMARGGTDYTPRDYAMVGAEDAIDFPGFKGKMWLGKLLMLGSDWHGEKGLT